MDVNVAVLVIKKPGGETFKNLKIILKKIVGINLFYKIYLFCKFPKTFPPLLKSQYARLGLKISII